MFPRRDDATNKELILTLIDIQGYLSRYGKSHTNWHETINEVIERLEHVESEPQESKEVPQRIHGRWVGTEFDGYADGNPVYYEWKCSACGCVVEDEEPTWNYCPNCGADMRETG